MLNRFIRIITSMMPIAIIAVLFYAGLFLKPAAVTGGIEPPIITPRDYFYGVTVPTSMTIWACGSNAKIVRSDDAGVTWRVQPAPIDYNLQSIAAWDENRALAVGNEGVILLTVDGGENWKQVDAPLSKIANKLLRVRIFEGGKAWAVGEMGAVFYSGDFGQTWVRKLKEEDLAYNDIFFLDDKRGWLVGEYLDWESTGNMKITMDGGETWKGSMSPVEVSFFSVAFKDELNGVAVGLDGAVIVSHDGGNSWIVAPKLTKEHLFSIVWTGSNWVAVGGKGMMVTGDSPGEKWEIKRMAHWDLSWYTDITTRENRYYLAGASLSLYENGQLKLFGRETPKF